MDSAAAGVWFAPQEVSFAESHPLSGISLPVAQCQLTTAGSMLRQLSATADLPIQGWQTHSPSVKMYDSRD